MEMIGYKLVGTGKEKVLVMHSWLGDSSSYDYVLPYLNAEKFTYLFIDLRGYGSSKDFAGEYSLQEATQDVMKVVDSLTWDRFHLVGYSMSGMIAQKIALDNVLRVKSMVAITPVPASGSPSPPEVLKFLEEAARGNPECMIECIRLLTSRRLSNFVVKKIVKDWQESSIDQARLGYLQMFSHTDFSQAVKGLKTPMLMLHAEYDVEGSEGLICGKFLSLYPNLQIECCKGSGHLLPRETPLYLASIMERFISAHI